jgi:hypothetical protein
MKHTQAGVCFPLQHASEWPAGRFLFQGVHQIGLKLHTIANSRLQLCPLKNKHINEVKQTKEIVGSAKYIYIYISGLQSSMH